MNTRPDEIRNSRRVSGPDQIYLGPYDVSSNHHERLGTKSFQLNTYPDSTPQSYMKRESG